MNKGKRSAAAYVHAECSNSALNTGCPQHLNEILNIILNPSDPITEWETVDWCQWLMAGGRKPEEFADIGIVYIFSFNYKNQKILQLYVFN